MNDGKCCWSGVDCDESENDGREEIGCAVLAASASANKASEDAVPAEDGRPSSLAKAFLEASRSSCKESAADSSWLISFNFARCKKSSQPCLPLSYNSAPEFSRTNREL